jgi:peptide-methionine (S)-S-oxide reductase
MRIRIVLISLLLILAGSTALSAVNNTTKATFAGGCFWCMEGPFDRFEGVVSTISGYAGGHVKAPSYEEVSAGGTGHAEVVRVIYDPEKVSYETLLAVFWRNIDPFDGAGQFCDRGSSYRPAIYYHNERQRRLAEESKARMAERFDRAIEVEIEAVKNYHPAEQYHQNYYKENPLRYKFYRSRCGRDARLEEVWGEEAGGSHIQPR